MHFLKLRARLAVDSFVYTKQRKSATKNIISVTIAITLAVLVSLLIAVAVGYNPGEIIQQLFTKGFIDWHKLIFNIVVLGVGALAFSFAFRAGVFNIGIAGQMLAAGLTVLVVSTAMKDVNTPPGAGQILMLVIAIAAGAAVASMVAAMKVYLKVNEVISSILINWIMFFVVRLIIQKFYSDPSQLLTQSFDIPEQFRLVAPGIGGWLPALIILIVLAGIMLVVIKYTVFGHKVVSVGMSLTASKYAGYNVRAINIATMAISGGIAGILAYILYTAGDTPSIPVSTSIDSLPAEGMNGVAIGLIAMSNPIAILPVSFIIGLFMSSAPFLSTPVAFSNLIIGFVMLGAAMFTILLHYKPWLWIKEKLYGYYAPKHYQGFENSMESLVSKFKSLISLKENEAKARPNNVLDLDQQKLLNSYETLKQQVESQGANASAESLKELAILEFKVNQALKNLVSNPKGTHKIAVNWKELEQELYANYCAERTELVAQYKKHILVTKATQFFFPEVEAKNILNVKNHKDDVQFVKAKARKVAQIEQLEEKLSVETDMNKQRAIEAKINKLVAEIEKDQQQLFKWKAKNETRLYAWYNWKSRAFGNVDKHYERFLKQAQKLKLDAEQKALVIEWVEDSYKEAKEAQVSKGAM